MCAVEGCGRPVHARGLCPGHYGRWYREVALAAGPTRACARCGAPIPAVTRRRYCSRQCRLREAGTEPVRLCDVAGCERPHLARGMCRSHYRKSRGWDRRPHRYELIGALVDGVAARLQCERVPPAGLWVLCHGIVGIPDPARPAERWCSGCGAQILLNADELAMARHAG